MVQYPTYVCIGSFGALIPWGTFPPIFFTLHGVSVLLDFRFLCFPHIPKNPPLHGDQTGRIFTDWANVYFDQSFLNDSLSTKTLGYLLKKVTYCFFTKNVLGHIWVILKNSFGHLGPYTKDRIVLTMTAWQIGQRKVLGSNLARV
jgi:hypothetical protein